MIILGGGQGTRLGFDGPKGLYDINLPSNKSLFQLYAERVLKVQELAATNGQFFDETRPRQGEGLVPVLVMTSPLNHQTTVDFFRNSSYFGLEESQIRFFPQGTLPALDPTDGKIIMESGLPPPPPSFPPHHFSPAASCQLLLRTAAAATVAAATATVAAVVPWSLRCSLALVLPPMGHPGSTQCSHPWSAAYTYACGTHDTRVYPWQAPNLRRRRTVTGASTTRCRAPGLWTGSKAGGQSRCMSSQWTMRSVRCGTARSSYALPPSPWWLCVHVSKNCSGHDTMRPRVPTSACS